MPNTLSLDEAIRDIVEARNQQPVPHVSNPFVFVVGAGISDPSVKTAGWITSRCEKLARGKKVQGQPPSETAIDRYSFWFGKAFPDRITRQYFIRRLVEKAPISGANFRLAHLLIAGFTNLVITPNFDLLLSRALRIFGYDDFRVCDHPATTARITPELNQTQIIHVHGTFPFYDIVNLKGEVDRRSRDAMAELLDAVFRDRVPIVIGYSGWEGDVITRALKRRLSRKDWQPPYTTYWFCYRTCPALDWLCASDVVRFVVPEKGTTLSAEDALGRLIREMGYREPDLASRPIQFLAEQLELSLPRRGQPDPYSLRSVAARIRRAAELEEVVFKETDAQMELVRSCLRMARYEDAATAILGLPFDKLNNPQLEDLVEKVESIASFVPKSVQARLLQVRTLAQDQLKALIAYEDEVLFLGEP
jgi:hypothetical protein